VALAQALFEGVVQGGSGKRRFAVLEIAFHHLLVDLDDLVDDALVRVGDRPEVGVAVGIEEAVDDLRATLGRQVDRQALGPECFAQFVDERAEPVPATTRSRSVATATAS
jgi:hypothetical protein